MNDKEYVRELLLRIKIEREKEDRSGIYGYIQRKMAYNSNRIEGSTLTEEQTATLFDTKTIIADGEIIRSKDIEEMTGHFLMFNYMLDTIDLPLSEDLIKQFHYNLKVGVFEDRANGYPCGEYKNRKNMVSNISVTNPSDVPERMKQFIFNYHNKTTHSLEDLALMHSDYERIHPFQDGNGRTGRLILFRECIKNDIVPLIINNDNKPLYINALNSYQNNKDNGEKLISYLKSEQTNFYENTVDFIYPVMANKIIK